MKKNKLILTLDWFFCYPLQIWLFLFLIGLNIFCIRVCHFDATIFNKIYGTALQIIGVVVIITKVNSNIEKYRNLSILGLLKHWLYSCPFCQQSYFQKLTANLGINNNKMIPNISTSKKCSTLEELQQEMYFQINELLTLTNHNHNELKNRINLLERNSTTEIDDSKKDFKEFREETIESFIGDYKNELFGVFLVLYGAVLPLFEYLK